MHKFLSEIRDAIVAWALFALVWLVIGYVILALCGGV